MRKAGALKVRVAGRTHVASDTVALELVGLEGEALAPFTAGAHLNLHLPNGLVRPYSIVNSPRERNHYVVAVLREAQGRGGSLTLHDAVQVGDTLDIDPPNNGFGLNPTPHHKILIAGGIGITPFLSMADVLYTHGASFELHYSAKNRQRAAFIDDLLGAPYADRVRTYLTADGGERLRIRDRLAQAPQDAEVYVCGPERLVDAAVAAARELGWSDHRVRWEAFGARPVDASGNGAFRVRLAASGRSLAVPADKTIADVLLEHGVPVGLSCAQGVCGTCLTRVLEGEPDHRDLYLTPDEQARNDQMLICCSRSRSPELVLDL